MLKYPITCYWPVIDVLFLTPMLLSNVKFSSTRRPPSSPAKVISPPKQTRRCNTSSLTSTLKACKKGGNDY